MNRATRSSSTSRTPADTGTQLSRNILELFRTQRQLTHAASQTALQAQAPDSPETASASQMSGAETPSCTLMQTQPPSLLDLEKFDTDIKSTVTAAIADLRSDFQDLQTFCDQLDLPRIDLSEWYSFYYLTEPWIPVSLNPSPKAQ